MKNLYVVSIHPPSCYDAYGITLYALVETNELEEAKRKANRKFNHLTLNEVNQSFEEMDELEIHFDDDGISQLLGSSW